jgi:hypothetical protein
VTALDPGTEPDHSDWNCPNCHDCPGCGGGDGSDPVNPVFDRTTYPGLVMLYCGDCHGEAVLCDCKCHVIAAREAAAEATS